MPRLQLQVAEKQQLAPELFRLRLIPTIPTSLDFLPGQYMSLAVSGPVRRSYSIANPPAQNTYFETYADTSPGGPGSIFIRKARVGDEIDSILPLGRFNYQVGTGPVYFCATGSGLVPLLSMLKHELIAVNSGREIHLYLGARDQAELIEHEVLLELASSFQNFHYYPHLSQSDVLGTPSRITSSIAKLAKLANSQAYICGGPEMIAEVEALLISKGINSNQIFYERYY